MVQNKVQTLKSNLTQSNLERFFVVVVHFCLILKHVWSIYSCLNMCHKGRFIISCNAI